MWTPGALEHLLRQNGGGVNNVLAAVEDEQRQTFRDDDLGDAVRSRSPAAVHRSLTTPL
jgi:hypothetical protein